MIQRVTITRVEVKHSPADAQKPWKKLGIQTQQHGDKWLGAFFNKYNEKALEALKDGVSVDILVEASPDGKYLNFRIPSQLDRLEARVSVLERSVNGSTGTDMQESHEEVNTDDIPF